MDSHVMPADWKTLPSSVRPANGSYTSLWNDKASQIPLVNLWHSAVGTWHMLHLLLSMGAPILKTIMKTGSIHIMVTSPRIIRPTCRCDHFERDVDHGCSLTTLVLSFGLTLRPDSLPLAMLLHSRLSKVSSVFTSVK